MNELTKLKDWGYDVRLSFVHSRRMDGKGEWHLNLERNSEYLQISDSDLVSIIRRGLAIAKQPEPLDE